MSFHVLIVRKEYDPFAIRRRMRKPVVVFVLRHLLWFGAVGMHAPDLHAAAPLGIEVDLFAVRRKIRAIIQPRGGGQSNFISAFHRSAVDIEFAVTLATIQ